MIDYRPFTVVNLTLSTIVDTEIVFDFPVCSVLIQNRGAGDLYLREEEDAASYITIAAGTHKSFDFMKFAHVQFIGWLRAQTGVGPAEIIGIRVGA